MSFISSQIAGALFVAWLLGVALGYVFRVLDEIHYAVFRSPERGEGE